MNYKNYLTFLLLFIAFLLPNFSFAQDFQTAAAAQQAAAYIEAKNRMNKRMEKAKTAMQNYFEDKKHLPSNTTEIDDFLKANFQYICNENIDANSAASSDGNMRALGKLRFFKDDRCTNPTSINNEIIAPSDWSAPPESVVIATDGINSCFIWGAGVDGKPMMQNVFKCEPNDDDDDDK